MALNVKVGLIGPFDMLKFKNMAKVREKAIQSAAPKDVTGEYAINKNAKALHPDRLRLIVKEIIEHKGADAKTFVFAPAEGTTLPMFRAGEYLSLKLKIGDSFVTRPYSISSSPAWVKEGRIAITVRANPGGFAANWMLANLKTGMEVLSSAAEGQFYYEPLRDAKQVVALAGGSGITPFLSMAYAIRDGIEDFDLTILFGSRTADSILFKEELDRIAKACGRVKVVHVLSDETVEGFEHGFIDAELIQKYAPEGEYSIFLCGPEAMYRFAQKEIEKLGLPRRLVRREMLGVTKKVAALPGFPAEAVGKRFNLTVRQGVEVYALTANSEEPVLVAIE
ncbi:MAG: FAD-binding oxidoreductase, partial [Eubacteriales bacterium]|nr:FAD-binding oxidoreductase [Eubacteriales bacterium]